MAKLIYRVEALLLALDEAVKFEAVHPKGILNRYPEIGGKGDTGQRDIIENLGMAIREAQARGKDYYTVDTP